MGQCYLLFCNPFKASKYSFDTFGMCLQQVETIGDAYMVVGGLPEPQSDHTKRIAEFALEVQKILTHLLTFFSNIAHAHLVKCLEIEAHLISCALLPQIASYKALMTNKYNWAKLHTGFLRTGSQRQPTSDEVRV